MQETKKNDPTTVAPLVPFMGGPKHGSAEQLSFATRNPEYVHHEYPRGDTVYFKRVRLDDGETKLEVDEWPDTERHIYSLMEGIDENTRSFYCIYRGMAGLSEHGISYPEDGKERAASFCHSAEKRFALYAAAPDLLEACEEMLSELDCYFETKHFDPEETGSAMRLQDAIKKARGE